MAAAATTLDDVKARGKLLCGVNPGLQGFAAQDAAGQWAGFDVDFCKAVAAASLGDAAKVEFVPVNAQERFDKLKSRRHRHSGAQHDLDDGPRDQTAACVSPVCPITTGRASSSRSCWA